jgi:hypothetical protein
MGANQNAIGNLVLNLCGNVQQWIVSGVGGETDVRDRAAEFAQFGGLTVCRRAKMRVISEIFPGQRLGSENDLAGVLREVFYDRINQLENSFLLMLNQDRLGKPAGRQCADDLPGLLERCFESDLQIAGRA